MIISIDVGIKNLSTCVITREGEIRIWEIVDLSCDDPISTCNHIKKNGVCGKRALYTLNDVNYYCGTHVKQSDSHVAPMLYYKLLGKHCSKKTIKELNHLVDGDKTQNELSTYIFSHYITKLKPTVSSSALSLVDIGRIISTKLPKFIPKDGPVCVLIENQISPIANRMKCIQSMIVQFFIEKGIFDIHFISSLNKLKNYDVPKKTYKERKQSGIIVTRTLIDSTWLEKFNQHKKKDDLADSYLQAKWFISI